MTLFTSFLKKPSPHIGVPLVGGRKYGGGEGLQKGARPCRVQSAQVHLAYWLFVYEALPRHFLGLLQAHDLEYG